MPEAPPAAADAATAPRRRRLGTALRLLAGALVVAAAVAAWALRGRLAVEPLIALLDEARGWGPFAFVGLYALLSVLLVPTLPLNLGAGVLWGPLLGGVYSAAGATLGGALSFLLARHLLGPSLTERWRGGRWDLLRAELARNDWRVVAVTRLSPVFPTGALNYCYGVTPLPLRTFLWSTLVFLLPGSIVFAGLGALAGEVVLAGEHRRLAAIFVASMTAVTALITLRWALRRRVGRLVEGGQPAAAAAPPLESA